MRSVAVKCDADSAARLRTIAKLWPRVIAAQQSNILRDAENYSDSNFRAHLRAGDLTVNSQPSIRIRFNNEAMSPMDEIRLIELIELWSSLRPSSQEQLIDTVELVTGTAVA
jgi:hypothetical protein